MAHAIVRRETPNDFAAIARVVAAAFGSQVEAKLVEDIRASPEYVPETDSSTPCHTESR